MTNNKRPASALQEKSGIPQPSSVNADAVGHIRELRKVQPSVKALVDGILSGNITDLSRAITMVESVNADHFQKATELVKECLPHANKSIRIAKISEYTKPIVGGPCLHFYFVA